jgi:type I restriction enzyme R subunit
MRRLIDAPDSDLFDVLSYIRFSNPPKTREERADAVEAKGLAAAKGEMRKFLLGVLEAYSNHGEGELALGKLTAFLNARYGTIADAKGKLGELGAIKKAFIDVQRELYAR